MATYIIRKGSMHETFFNSRKKLQVLAGGFGNGKTAAMCVKAYQIANDYPGSNGLMARETYPKLNDTLRREFYKWIPENEVQRWPTKDDNTLILRNGSTINFRYIMQRGKASVDGQTTSNLLSATYDWIVVDQMEDPGIRYKDFLDLWGRLRGSTPYKGHDPSMPISGPRWMMLSANPTANWFYKRIIKPYHRYKTTGLVDDEMIADPNTREPLMEVIEGSTYENAHNLDEDFIQMLEATYKGQMKKRFLMGEWAAYEGLVYPQYETTRHVLKHDVIMDILEEAHRSRSGMFDAVEGFDFGLSSPSCYLLGFVDYMGRVIYVDGFYATNMSVNSIAASIKEIRERYGMYIHYAKPIWADPAIFKKAVMNGVGKSATTIAKMLREATGYRIQPGQNNITSGIAKVSQYLNLYEGFGLGEEATGPLMLFSDRLTFVEDEILAYFWKTNSDGEREDVPRDVNDHAMDTIKYSVSKLPAASELMVRVPDSIPEYMKWQEVA